MYMEDFKTTGVFLVYNHLQGVHSPAIQYTLSHGVGVAYGGENVEQQTATRGSVGHTLTMIITEISALNQPMNVGSLIHTRMRVL